MCSQHYSRWAIPCSEPQVAAMLKDPETNTKYAWFHPVLDVPEYGDNISLQRTLFPCRVFKIVQFFLQNFPNLYSTISSRSVQSTHGFSTTLLFTLNISINKNLPWSSHWSLRNLSRNCWRVFLINRRTYFSFINKNFSQSLWLSIIFPSRTAIVHFLY